MSVLRVPEEDGQRAQRASATSERSRDDRRRIDDLDVSHGRRGAGAVSVLRRGGATYHFCPKCGSTAYWDIAVAPDVVGVAVGGFADPSFPPPMISGFEAYGHPWAMNASQLAMPHYETDGTEHGAARA